jgi:hypothetical protein
MKRTFFLALFLSCLIFPSFGQKIFENTDKPRNKNAGRTTILEEVKRIEDDGTNAIFKIPQKLLISEDGSIYFLDYLESSNLYKYSRDGQFIFKILKQGQGPRECQWATNFFIQGDKIRVQAWSPPKVMDYNFEGKYIRETKTRNTHGLWLLTSIDGKIFGIRDEIPHSEAIHKEGIIYSPYRLYEISDDFQNWTALHDFPVEHYIYKARWPRRTMVAAAVYKHWLFMLHTAEYQIDKFDTQKGEVERIITRQYRRQKTQSSATGQDVTDRELKGLSPPPSKYQWDIMGIWIFRDTLWILTGKSEFSDSSRRQIDVFDMDGVYIDSFYIQFPDNGMRHFYGGWYVTNDGFLFAIEQEGEGYISLVKYKINDFN